MIVLAKPVSFARVKHQFRGLAAIFQGPVEFLRLPHRHPLVVRTVQDQGGRGHLVDVGHRRPFQVERQGLGAGDAPEIADQHTGNVVGAVHAPHVGKAGADHGRLEAAGLRDHPRRHVAAVAPADVRQFVGVGDAPRHQRVHAGHDVLVVAAAPVVDVVPQKLLAVVRAAARVGIEHRPALVGPHLPTLEAAQAEAVHVCTGGATVRHHQRRMLGARRVAHRLQQHALHLHAVGAFPGDHFGVALRQLSKLRVRDRQLAEGRERRIGDEDL